MGVNYKCCPRIKLFGISSYSDDLDHDLLHGYSNYRNIKECRDLINEMLHNFTECMCLNQPYKSVHTILLLHSLTHFHTITPFDAAGKQAF